MKKYHYLLILCLFCNNIFAQNVGEKLSPWQKGYMDIHHINTGCGACAYLVLPDGTTMMIDAGENDSDADRHVALKPDKSKYSGEWIVDYVNAFAHDKDQGIDYMLLTHFHSDHIGGVFKTLNSSGKYYNTGAITVAENLRVGKIIDRDFPDYSFLTNHKDPRTMNNYLNFIKYSKKKYILEKFEVGSKKQFALLHDSVRYKDSFSIQNIYSNGRMWTGKDTVTHYVFPPFDSIASHDIPQENSLSCVVKITYGKFSYYTGGDVTGYPKPGRSSFHDVESRIAPMIGKTEVCCINHHGYNNATNDVFIATLRPRVFIIQAIDALHPNHTTLDRMMSKYIYSGERDIFATNLHPAARIVIGALADKMKSTQGHIVIRIFDGGEEYSVYILNDESTDRKIKAIYGPYKCY